MSRELVMMVTWQRSGLLKNISTQSASLISLKHPACKHVEQIEELHPKMVVQDAGSCNLYICMSGNVIDWIFAHNACNDSVKEPMQKYITASKVVLQYVDNIFLSAETGAEPLKMI